MANKIIRYRRDLKSRAQELRKNLTITEQLVWEKIRKRSLGVEFHRQVPLLDYIVDFYCHEIELVIEIDGSSHDHQFLEDAKRQGRLETYGLRFLRFSNNEVLYKMGSVLISIKESIKESIS